MPSSLQETLFDKFQSVAPDQGLGSVLASGEAIASALERAASQATQATSNGQSDGVGSAIADSALKIFTSGLGLAPLVSGLFGLFGGGGAPEPPPLVKYAMPDRLYFQGADVGNGIYSSDYDQTGMPRMYSGAQTATGSGPAGATSAPIQVNVQAMDAKSFLDHSSEIAEAVRQAMLNLSPINDVVNDL